MKWNFGIGLFDRATGAIKGYLNFEEIWKSVVTAVGAAGSILTVLTSINDFIVQMTGDPFIVQLIHRISGDANDKRWFSATVGLFVLLSELYRRSQHGGQLLPVKDIMPVVTQMEVAPLIPVNPNIPPTPAPIVAVLTEDPHKPPAPPAKNT